MTKQPEALRLANWLDALDVKLPGITSNSERAAAEMRRLHAENERLRARRDALLEALRWIDQRCPRSILKHPPHLIHQEMAYDAGVRARAAIKAVKRATK